MKIFFKNIKSDKILAYGFSISSMFIFLNIIYVIFFYTSLPPAIPLFNQMPWGEARLGTKWQIFIPVFMALLIFIGNLFLSSVFYKKIPLISRMLAVTSFLICFFALLFSARTIQLIL